MASVVTVRLATLHLTQRDAAADLLPLKDLVDLEVKAWYVTTQRNVCGLQVYVG